MQAGLSHASKSSGITPANKHTLPLFSVPQNPPQTTPFALPHPDISSAHADMHAKD